MDGKWRELHTEEEGYLVIHSAKPGCVRQLRPRKLKLQNLGQLPTNEVERIMREAEAWVSSLTVHRWTPHVGNSCQFDYHAGTHVCSACDATSEIGVVQPLFRFNSNSFL